MGIETAIAAIGVAVSAAGTIGGVIASQHQASAQRHAEELRQQAMNLDAERRKREIVRQSDLQRAQAQSVAVAQGADQSSVLPGAYGSIGGQEGRNYLGVAQNQQIGNGIFAANQQASQAASMGYTFAGLGSLGGTLVKQAPAVDRIGTTYNQGQGTSNYYNQYGGSLSSWL